MKGIGLKDLRPGDLIFTYKKKSPVAFLIDLFSERGTKEEAEEKIAHVAFYAGGWGHFIYEALVFGGLCLTSLRKYRGGKHHVYVGRIKNMTGQEYLRIKKAFDDDHEAKKKREYSLKSFIRLFSSLLMKLSRRKDNPYLKGSSLFCSNIIRENLREEGREMFSDIGFGMVTPLDFWEHDDVIKVGELDFSKKVDFCF